MAYPDLFTLRDALNFLKAKLISMTWTSSATPVFSDVVIGQFFTRDKLGQVNPPAAFISIGKEDISNHGGEEEPIFRDAEVVIGVIARVESDSYGGGSLMGAREVGQETVSMNAGLLEIQPVLYDFLRKGAQSDDFRFTYINRGRPRPVDRDNPTMTLMEYLYRVRIAESMESEEP